MIRRVLLAIAAVLVPVASFGVLTRRASQRLLSAPRTTPDEAGLGPALDGLGGEVVRIRSRDGLRLSARWLAAEPGDPTWTTVPLADARRLAAAAPPGAEHWEVPGADHSDAHRADPSGYEWRTTNHLRAAFVRAREADL